MVPGIKPGIGSGLGQVQGIGRARPWPVGSFDFFDDERIDQLLDAINAPFKFKNEVRGFVQIGNENFRQVTGRARFLETLMSKSACERAIGTGEMTAGAEVASAKKKADQIADGNGIDWFGSGHGSGKW